MLDDIFAVRSRLSWLEGEAREVLETLEAEVSSGTT
jgi:hypothetical protein